MAIKKSQLYSSIWKSCDELRGGMDASQYKDYVLVLLFIKYISDKYAGQDYAPITIPEGSSFRDMVALKGKTTIGDDINKKIIAPIADANKLSGMPDFNDNDKLGSGADMVKRLSNLIAIFEDPNLDFSNNKAEGDDILGDAYEYLMRHFATESGKSKGQFYTPSEVSRIIAKVVGIAETTNKTPTVYDPACGSGSLLLKVADETTANVQLYGQEMDNATATLARMNMILHDNATALIERENTLSTPQFKDGEKLKTFDFVIANPPFSYKSWTNGVKTGDDDTYGRFTGYGTPPDKNGDYAFLLHILKSLKSTGKGAVILPHGVLFRGNAEAEIRTNIIKRGYIKGIIGLPANLFYGTGIPACIIVIDKENGSSNKGVFMIDASKGYVKDGNKNRLRAQDIHRIVDTFNKQLDTPKFARMVPIDEVQKNEFNLNIPRYIDSQEPEDLQNIEAHLKGGIPNEDIEALQAYWQVYPTLKNTLFKKQRDGYSSLTVSADDIKQTIFLHNEFIDYAKKITIHFESWKNQSTTKLKAISIGAKPKELIHELSEDMLAAFSRIQLIDKYDMYQYIMEYWAETMQDDLYLIAADGWKAELTQLEGKKGEFECELIPKYLVINRYFATEKQNLQELEAQLEAVTQEIADLVEEHSGEEDTSYFSQFDKVKKAAVLARKKEIQTSKQDTEERTILEKYIALIEKETKSKKDIKDATQQLETAVRAKYQTLSKTEIKVLVVDDKWITTISKKLVEEMDRISQRLTERIKELAQRYATPLPDLEKEVTKLKNKVDEHLKKMGFYYE